MPEINIHDEVYSRVLEFKPVVEAIIDGEMTPEDFVVLLLGRGIDSMVYDILGDVDADTLLKSFQQLGAIFPKQVYGFMVDSLNRGEAIQEREGMRHRIGFRPQATLSREFSE